MGFSDIAAVLNPEQEKRGLRSVETTKLADVIRVPLSCGSRLISKGDWVVYSLEGFRWEITVLDDKGFTSRYEVYNGGN